MIIIGSSALMPNPSLLKIGLVMDATDLKVFEAVARHGSMNRAAAELNTVQSNVTARVRALELELGVLLFQRHARGVKVTPAGRRMLPFSARISRLLSDAKAAARMTAFRPVCWKSAPWKRLRRFGSRQYSQAFRKPTQRSVP